MTLYPKDWQVLESSFNTKRVNCEAKVKVTEQGPAWPGPASKQEGAAASGLL